VKFRFFGVEPIDCLEKTGAARNMEAAG
jgi:hypothetical protein